MTDREDYLRSRDRHPRNHADRFIENRVILPGKPASVYSKSQDSFVDIPEAAQDKKIRYISHLCFSYGSNAAFTTKWQLGHSYGNKRTRRRSNYLLPWNGYGPNWRKRPIPERMLSTSDPATGSKSCKRCRRRLQAGGHLRRTRRQCYALIKLDGTLMPLQAGWNCFRLETMDLGML